VGGQADDLADHTNFCEVGREVADWERNRALNYLESIHQRKTGALFAASLELGGIAVGASQMQRAHLAGYAAPFGLAFQIVDDLLDFLGSTEQVGKRTGKDLERGKLTFPGLIGVDASRQRAEQLIAVAARSATLLGSHSQRLIGLAQYVLQRSR
jgi:geranylgeranyl diphosphate synthase type II